jgi:hypothetical protein
VKIFVVEASKLDGLFIEVKLPENKYLNLISEPYLRDSACIRENFTAVLDPIISAR